VAGKRGSQLVSPRASWGRRRPGRVALRAATLSDMAIFRVPINFTHLGAGSPSANIWHIRTSTVNTATELSEANTLVGYIRTFYNSCLGLLPPTWVATLGTVVSETDQREIIPTMASLTGLGTGSAPQALAIVVGWRTTIAARRGRGRTFLGPVASGVMQTDGTVTDANLTTVRTAAAALISSSTAFGNGAVGVWGYENAKLPGKENLRNPADGKIFRDFVGVQVRDLFGVLRSRRD
jgi:hypothetical protein